MEILVQLKKIENENFSINNISKEIFWMYQWTLWNISKNNLKLFILSFFLFIKKDNKSVLRLLIEENKSNLVKFITDVNKRNTYLKKWEYAELKRKYGLKNLLDNDIFLLCLDSVREFHEFDNSSIPKFLSKKEYLDEIDKINYEHKDFLENISKFYNFNKIEDYRNDDNGNTNDLSKRLSHMINMRQSKKMIIWLEKFTKVESITSNSPIDFTFIQYINPEYFVHLWQSFHLFSFLSLNINPSELFDNLKDIKFDAKLDIGDIIALLALWEQRRQWNITKNELKKANNERALLEKKLKDTEEAKEIVNNLSEKIIDTKIHIEKRIAYLKGKLESLMEMRQTKRIKEEVTTIIRELSFLENLEIQINKE